MTLATAQPHLTHVQLVQAIMDNVRQLGLHPAAAALARAQHFDIDLDLPPAKSLTVM